MKSPALWSPQGVSWLCHFQAWSFSKPPHSWEPWFQYLKICCCTVSTGAVHALYSESTCSELINDIYWGRAGTQAPNFGSKQLLKSTSSWHPVHPACWLCVSPPPPSARPWCLSIHVSSESPQADVKIKPALPRVTHLRAEPLPSSSCKYPNPPQS